MRVFANHIGFDKTDDKTAVLELEKEAAELTAWLDRMTERGMTYP